MAITPWPESEKLVDEKTFVMLPFTPMDSSIQGGESRPSLMIVLPCEHIMDMVGKVIRPGEAQTGAAIARRKIRQRVAGVRGEFDRFVVCEPDWVFSCIFCKKHPNGALHQLNRLEVNVRTSEDENK